MAKKAAKKKKTLAPKTAALSAEEKAERLTADIKAGHVLQYPLCENCGWQGEEPAVTGAGCPECGERVFLKGKPKQGELGEEELEDADEDEE